MRRCRTFFPLNSLRPAALVLFVLVTALGAHAQLRESEVTLKGEDGLQLKGTLCLPDSSGIHPAILLLPGSGPTDRDGNQHPVVVTDLLKQLAELLASEGVATLRYDKRATRQYAARWPRKPEELDDFFAWENFVTDASGALAFLRDHDEVDSARVAILGHSEGGLIALQLGHDLAGTPRAPAGLILMATAGRTLDVVLREQVEASLNRAGAGPAAKERMLNYTDQAITAILEGEALPDDLPRELQPLFNPTVLRLLRSYFTIDPADLARATAGPVLIVQGKSDIQVSVQRDTPRLRKALEQRVTGEVEVAAIPGASHNLKEANLDPLGFRGPLVEPAKAAITNWARRHLLDATGEPVGTDEVRE